MARGPDRSDPLAAIRRLLRELRSDAPLSSSSTVELLFPRVPIAERQATVANVVRIALFRLPTRQRELLTRYDLEGELAAKVRQVLGLSPRQFFRDRRAALSLLNAQLFGPGVQALQRIDSPQPIAKATGLRERGSIALGAPSVITRISAPSPIRDAELLRQTYARSLSQAGDADCLRILRELATQVQEPKRRAELLLDLADEAYEYDADGVALEALSAVGLIVSECNDEADRSSYLLGRLARARGRIATTFSEAESEYSRATTLLRRAVLGSLGGVKARSALAETLGDIALHHFGDGAFAEARMASFEACRVIEVFELGSARTLEIRAMDAVLEACIAGNVAWAIEAMSSFLDRAVESGWFSTVHRLGANLVGLNAVRGDYEQAIRWYERLSSSPPNGARPRDRTHLMLEASHSYTMSGRPHKALAILGYVKPGDGCPSAETPAWHSFASAALERAGHGTAALAEAHQALDGYTAQECVRGVSDAHRHIATAQAKLGNARAATEHILEAQRLTETHGTPYAVLRTLVAKADILGSASLKMEALDLARFLLKLGNDPAPVRPHRAH